MDNSYDNFTQKEKEQAYQLTVWMVWYEDKFGWGDDRDPAIPLDAFLTEEEANKYAIANGGFIDTGAGKFDGREVEKSNLWEIMYMKLLPAERIKELLSEALRKKLIK